MGIFRLGILKQNSYFPLLLLYFFILESGAINDITATNNGHVILIAIFQSLSSVYSGILRSSSAIESTEKIKQTKLTLK